MMATIRITITRKGITLKTRLQLTVLPPMLGGCTICMVMFMSGAVIGMAAIITRSARRKVRLKIRLAPKPVRAVSCVVAAGTAMRGAVGRLIATAAPPAAAAAMLASAWSSSRSQLAAHSVLYFEQERADKRVENGSEGRAPCTTLFRQRTTQSRLVAAEFLSKEAPVPRVVSCDTHGEHKNSCTSINYTLKYAVKMLRRLTALVKFSPKYC